MSIPCTFSYPDDLFLFEKQGISDGFDSCDRPSDLTQIGFKASIFHPVWPWNLMDDLTKQQDTSSILCNALCIATNPLVNSNWSYSPEMFNSVQNQWCLLSRVTLKFDGWPLKIIGHLFSTTSSFALHFKAMGEFKLGLQSGNTQFG